MRLVSLISKQIADSSKKFLDEVDTSLRGRRNPMQHYGCDLKRWEIRFASAALSCRRFFRTSRTLFSCREKLEHGIATVYASIEYVDRCECRYTEIHITTEECDSRLRKFAAWYDEVTYKYKSLFVFLFFFLRENKDVK